MPAVTPAAVHIVSELRMKIGSAIDVDGGEFAGQPLGEGPMRGHPAAVQQPRLGREKCARADGDDAAGVAGDGFDPADEFGVGSRGIHAAAAGQHDGVDGSGRSGPAAAPPQTPGRWRW